LENTTTLLYPGWVFFALPVVSHLVRQALEDFPQPTGFDREFAMTEFAISHVTAHVDKSKDPEKQVVWLN
jgi:hypothetical protein